MGKIIFLFVLFWLLPTYSYINFILISVPGSGKGTFSQYLVNNYDYIQICPGDILRAEVNAQTGLGKKIQPTLEKGEYVDEDIVCNIILDRLTQAIREDKPFIVDGFPRSEYSFQFLHQFIQKKGIRDKICFLQLISNDEICIQRIINRQICTTCHSVYNALLIPPISPNICDNCGERLSLRKADNEAIARNRLNYFHEQVEPLLSLAYKFYPVKIINSEGSIQNLKKEYDNLIQ